MPATAVSSSAPPPPTRNPRTGPLAALLIVAVLAGLAFAVLGSSSNNIVDPVAQAATRSSTAADCGMHISMQIASSAFGTPLTGVRDGSLDLRKRGGSLSLTMSLGDGPQAVQVLGSSTLRMDEIVDRSTVYLKLPSAAAGALGMLGSTARI